MCKGPGVSKNLFSSSPPTSFKDTLPSSGPPALPGRILILKYPILMWSPWISELRRWAISICIRELRLL